VTEDSAQDHRRVLVARALKLARKRYGTMRRFTTDLRAAIGWRTLSMAAVYAWEAGSTRIPAVALVAAADLAEVSLDSLLAAAASGEADLAIGMDRLESRLRRLEDRLELVESRISS
jgi:hypothetical protein